MKTYIFLNALFIVSFLKKRQHVRLAVCLHRRLVRPPGGRREPHRAATAHQVPVVRRGDGHAAIPVQNGRHAPLHDQPRPRLAFDEVNRD